MTGSQNWAGHLAHPAATAIHKQRKHVLTAIFSAALAVIAIVDIPRADAEPISWDLQHVIFSFGQSAMGSFTVQGGELTDWNIQLIGGTDPNLTNGSFLPKQDCVAFCGELLDVGIGESGIDVRTPLASDDTILELEVFFDTPLANLFDPARAKIAVNGASTIYYEKLINPSTLELLKSDTLRFGANASVTLTPESAATPEPASLFLFAVGSAPLAILVRHRLFRRKTVDAELK
jgi:hypothetical protein